jgi:hypothetical protein
VPALIDPERLYWVFYLSSKNSMPSKQGKVLHLIWFLLSHRIYLVLNAIITIRGISLGVA